MFQLCLKLRKDGHEVTVACQPDNILLTRLQEENIPVFVVPMRQDYDLLAAFRIAQWLRRERAHIIHAHHPRAHALALIAGALVPAPALIVSRRVSFRLKKWNLFSQLKYRSSRITRFIAVSEDIRNVLVSGGVPPGKVTVIYSGVDTQRFSPKRPVETVRKELGLPSDRPIVGNLTHFSWWKGQTVFLEAAQKVIQAGTKAHFLLVGKDTDGPELTEKIRSLGIGSHVTLAGFRTDIPDVLSLLSLNVLASLQGEGFSGVLREAMAMNVPVVATDVGGNRELVQTGVTGTLVPPNDPSTMAEAIRKTLDHSDHAKDCAAEARRRVLDRYSLQRTVEDTEALYLDIQETRGR